MAGRLLGALIVAALLCSGARAAPADEAAAGRLYYKLVDVGRSFASSVDYPAALAFFDEVRADADDYCAAYPNAAARGALERTVGAYGDVYRLWGEAKSAREDGEDALWHGSKLYREFDARYPGLFAALDAGKKYGEYNGRRFYLLKAVAAAINENFAAKYQEELKPDKVFR